MSVKRYGIYLAYAPTTDLRGQGLGRHLANMLRGAESRGDVRFVLACPGWLVPELHKLFADEGVSPHAYEVISTPGMPFVLRLYFMARWLTTFGARRETQSRYSWVTRLRSRFMRTRESVLEHFLAARNPLFFLLLLPLFVLVTLLNVLIAFVRGVGNILSFIKKDLGLLVKYTRDKLPLTGRLIKRLIEIVLKPQSSGFAFRLYRRIEVNEANILVRLINSRADIAAWYSPTAFWPEFNQIRGPKLMCVPDVVLSDFPVGFSIAGHDRMMHAFSRLQAAVRGANNYVTYSEDVKWNTLVRRYGVDPANVNVVPHGNNSLNGFLDTGIDEASSAVDEVCRTLILKAMCKSSRPEYMVDVSGFHFEYLFYASQFRPNKNVLTLLRAYEWLLRHRYAGVKLILTGNLDVMAEIRRFIEDHGLELDVLCLRGLSVRQLAACYRLARLAVNPSLSEGGFPFTFDEALSVGTPVVMSRIGVTEEVITDSALQAEMLFNPYDWQDMARKIAWALENREALLQRQKPIYDSRAQRTWAHVVDDYVSLLDTISREPAAAVTLP